MDDAWDAFFTRDDIAEIDAREAHELIQLDYEFWLDRVAGDVIPEATVVETEKP